MIGSSTPQNQFLTTGIENDTVRQNFELLNKLFASVLQGEMVPPANLVNGPVWLANSGQIFTGTSETTPGQLQIQITTKGNPVRVKLAPVWSPSAVGASLNLRGAVGSDSVGAYFGWKRIESNGNLVTISKVNLTNDAARPAATNQLIFPISLPAFEFDDVVPAGVYVYQFYFQLSGPGSLLAANLNVVAYELR